MEYQIMEKNGEKLILLEGAGTPIGREEDANTLIEICARNGTYLLLVEGKRLSEDFLRLRTGVAGAVLQKFAIYGVKVAAVLDKDRAKGKFKEFLAESNRGSMFRVYEDHAEAEHWLLEGPASS
ncbi:MAG: DUF4180 domain-containing protein [Synergistaceae bacterium]|jgi:hypothetical protein|nr:DUF4180 domain-containing protein [Synergistaceae bacterium]